MKYFQLEEALKLLEEFSRIESPSREKKYTDRFVDRLEIEFYNLGMNVKRIKQQDVGDFLECSIGEGKKKILLLGHTDTVFPSGTFSKRPFRVKEGMAFGPGVLDMKGGIVVLLYTLKEVIDNLPDGVKLVVFLNSDEEIGSIYSKDYIMNLSKDAAACLSFEPAKPGTLTVERKGIFSFEMFVKGVAVHSGVNYEKGRSAVEEISRKICALYDEVRDLEKGISVNVGYVQGGDKINIVAEEARAQVEIRYFQKEHERKIKEKVKRIATISFVEGTSTDIIVLSERPPLIANEGCRKLFEIAKEEAQKLGREIIGRKTGGGGDASFAAVWGVPVLDGLGPEGEDSHTDAEFVLVDSLPFKVALAARIILRIAEGGF
ncbi:MAG: glutamate carboxypeptidase [Caldanaerobacter sp.]|uniref:M20 family metallopeptidase n=1 Tax=Caldanaerobacter sp. TaxID=2930036 RepID=UPI0024AAFC71|nr:M20 family metallopeptidase [Caldanaerobacter sp.]MDI3517911.1 glutamate carboxypeptidase [Caldanaerobacter sp.]